MAAKLNFRPSRATALTQALGSDPAKTSQERERSHHLRSGQAVRKTAISHWSASQTSIFHASDQMCEMLNRIGCVIEKGELLDTASKITEDQNHFLNLAFNGAHLAGFVHGYLRTTLDRPKTAILHNLIVADTFRRSGVASTLLTHLEQWARAKGAERIALTSSARRYASHLFYEDVGFSMTDHAGLFEKHL